MTEKLEPYKPNGFFQEYLVDILGSLGPGLLYLSGLFFIYSPIVYYTYYKLIGMDPSLNYSLREVFLASKDFPGTFWFFIFTGISILIYVIGYFFFRKDPKEPDKASLNQLYKDDLNTLESDIKLGVKNGSKFWEYTEYKHLLNHQDFNKNKTALIKHFIQDNYGINSLEDSAFPYPALENYLKRRGILHLNRFVLWSAEGNRKNQRTKNYFNMLKIRLSYHHPEQCKTIIKNEAHVRLASSTWYVCNSLKIQCLFGFGILLLAFVLKVLKFQGKHGFFEILSHQKLNTVVQSLPYAIPSFVVLFIVFRLQKKINSFFHYQRMREIIFVLETAFTAFRKDDSALNPPFPEVLAKGSN